MNQNHSFINVSIKVIFFIGLIMLLFSCKKNNYNEIIDEGIWLIMNTENDGIKNNIETYLLFSAKHNKVSIRIKDVDFMGDYKFEKNNKVLTIYNSKKKEYNNSYIFKIDTILNDFEFYRFRLTLSSNKKNIIADRVVLKYFGNP